MMRWLRLLSVLCFAWPTAALLADERPNVLLILCDDLGYSDLGRYWWRDSGKKSCQGNLLTRKVGAVACCDAQNLASCPSWDSSSCRLLASLRAPQSALRQMQTYPAG
jgi:hypothetical protein